MNPRKPVRSALVALFVATVAACSTGPQTLDVIGTWTGTTLLPGPYATTLALTQAGNTVAGTIEIDGLLSEPFVGTLDESARTITWTVLEGCEVWSGTFDVQSEGTQMTGTVSNDQSGCTPPGPTLDGTISLTK